MEDNNQRDGYYCHRCQMLTPNTQAVHEAFYHVPAWAIWVCTTCLCQRRLERDMEEHRKVENHHLQPSRIQLDTPYTDLNFCTICDWSHLQPAAVAQHIRTRHATRAVPPADAEEMNQLTTRPRSASRGRHLSRTSRCFHPASQNSPPQQRSRTRSRRREQRDHSRTRSVKQTFVTAADVAKTLWQEAQQARNEYRDNHYDVNNSFSRVKMGELTAWELASFDYVYTHGRQFTSRRRRPLAPITTENEAHIRASITGEIKGMLRRRATPPASTWPSWPARTVSCPISESSGTTRGSSPLTVIVLNTPATDTEVTIATDETAGTEDVTAAETPITSRPPSPETGSGDEMERASRAQESTSTEDMTLCDTLSVPPTPTTTRSSSPTQTDGPEDGVEETSQAIDPDTSLSTSGMPATATERDVPRRPWTHYERTRYLPPGEEWELPSQGPPVDYESATTTQSDSSGSTIDPSTAYICGANVHRVQRRTLQTRGRVRGSCHLRPRHHVRPDDGLNNYLVFNYPYWQYQGTIFQYDDPTTPQGFATALVAEAPPPGRYTLTGPLGEHNLMWVFPSWDIQRYVLNRPPTGYQYDPADFPPAGLTIHGEMRDVADPGRGQPLSFAFNVLPQLGDHTAATLGGGRPFTIRLAECTNPSDPQPAILGPQKPAPAQ